MCKPLKQAAGFVVFKETNHVIEYLLVKAAGENHHWTPPKGHLEKDEVALEAAIRETEEETGIEIADIHVYYRSEKVVTYEPKGKNFTKQVTYWLARLINPHRKVILSHEHMEFKWLPLKQAKELAAYPEMQKLLDEFDEYLKDPENVV